MLLTFLSADFSGCPSRRRSGRNLTFAPQMPCCTRPRWSRTLLSSRSASETTRSRSSTPSLSPARLTGGLSPHYLLSPAFFDDSRLACQLSQREMIPAASPPPPFAASRNPYIIHAGDHCPGTLQLDPYDHPQPVHAPARTFISGRGMLNQTRRRRNAEEPFQDPDGLITLPAALAKVVSHSKCCLSRFMKVHFHKNPSTCSVYE